MLTQSPAVSTDSGSPERPPAVSPRPPGREQPAGQSGPPDYQTTLRQRVLSPHTLVSFAVALAVLWFVLRRLEIDPAAIWAQVRQANLLIYGIAFLLWYGSFFIRGWRWGRMLESAGLSEEPGVRIPATPGLAEIILLAFFANSIVPAKLGDAYRGYLLRRDAGVPFSAGFGTILAERLVDAMALVIVLACSALVLFGPALPAPARPALTLGALVLIAGVVGLALLWLTRDRVARFLPHRVRGAYVGLQGAVLGSLRRPALIFGIGFLLWLNDGMRVWFVARSIDAGISPAVAVLVAVMGALLTVIPFTPAGLGVVEVGVGSVLVGVIGLDPITAGSIILLDRVVAYWSLLVVGAILYAWRTRRDYQASAAAAPTTS